MIQGIEKYITDLDQIKVIQKGPLTVLQLLSGDECPEKSIAIIHLDGENRKVVNSLSDAVYMVISGVGFFIVWKGIHPETITVKAGDHIKIPIGTPYQDVGANLLMVSMNNPAYNASMVAELDS